MKKPTAWVLTAEDDVSIQAVFYRIHFKMEDNMELLNLSEELKNNAYPGRGIVIGKTPDGKQAVTAYFIMGRSEQLPQPSVRGGRARASAHRRLTHPSWRIRA